MLDNYNSQRHGPEIIIKIMIDMQIWINNSILKAKIVKNVDKAGKSIKKEKNKIFKKN